jgi:hypothetical protein
VVLWILVHALDLEVSLLALIGVLDGALVLLAVRDSPAEPLSLALAAASPNSSDCCREVESGSDGPLWCDRIGGCSNKTL